MSFLISIFIFILGASLGSFLSVVIHRTENKKKGMVLGRSQCPHCKKNLQTIDLVPVLNYIYLKGKCRYCHKPIAPHYFFLELSAGLILLLVYLKFPFFMEENGLTTLNSTAALSFLFYGVDSMLLIGIFFYDLQYLKIPDIFLYPFIVSSLFGSLALHTSSEISLGVALVISLIFFGGQRLISKGLWLGEGDVYLGAGMALLFGWQLFLISIVLTYVSGAIISLVLLASKKADGKTKIAFAPFMVFGTFITMFYGEQILNWYLHLLSY